VTSSHLQRVWRQAAIVLSLCSGASALRADAPPELRSTLKCAGSKQLVLCTAPIASTPGSRITYAQLNLLEGPKFLRAVSPKSSFSEENATRPKLKLLFVPSGVGDGTIVAELQAVVCLNNGQACPHIKRVLSAPVSVR
jgi:hypothetical protein